MLSALLNTTVIWLGSLLVYELLLKRETFHRLNRFYLLFTFTAGMVLPLLPWGAAVHFTVFHADLQPAAAPNREPGELRTGAASLNNGLPQNINWLLLLYAAGVALSVLYLLVNLFKLWRLYRGSTIYRQGALLIAETGQVHGPFSFMHILFVCRQTDYTPPQWQMVVQHETAHYHRRHLFDLALLQIAQLVFWFHPLVYLYRNKMRLLHEYEVDALQEQDIGDYGRFLLQQATVSRDYSLTHAFNFSPLKNRIQMLTKSPSKHISKTRFLVLLPLMSLSLWCCAQNGSKLAIDIKGEYAMRHDAVVEYSNTMPADTVMVLNADTIITVNPVSGAKETNLSGSSMVIVQKDPVPLTLNKQPIAKREELSSTPQCVSPGGEFGMKYLLEKAQLKPLLEELPDGKYHMAISEIIVDPSGKIALYRFIAVPILTGTAEGAQTAESPNSTMISKGNTQGPVFTFKLKQITPISMIGIMETAKLKIQKQLSEVLMGKDIAFTAAKNKQGIASPYFLDFENLKSGFLLGANFTIKAHKASAFDYSL